MGAAINYASTPSAGGKTLTAADASRTAPATFQDIMPTASAPNGGLYERIVIMPLATTTATVLRLWKYDGAAWHLYYEIAIPAQTITAGGVVQPTVLEAVDNPDLFPILLPAGWSFRATINDAQTGIHVQVEGGAF